MQRNIAWTKLTFLSFAVLLAFLAPAAYAKNCSMATAAGTYGLSDSGTVIGVGPRAAVGQVTFDAAAFDGNGKPCMGQQHAGDSFPVHIYRTGQRHSPRERRKRRCQEDGSVA